MSADSESIANDIQSFYQSGKLKPVPLNQWLGASGNKPELSALHKKILSLAQKLEKGLIKNEEDFEQWVCSMVQVVVGPS